MVEIVNISQWKCDDSYMVKPSAKIEPLQVSKDNEICFILFFSNCPQNIKSFIFLAIAEVRDLPVLDMNRSLRTQIS